MTPSTSTAPSNGILVLRLIRQSGSAPFPPIISKILYIYYYLENNFIFLE